MSRLSRLIPAGSIDSGDVFRPTEAAIKGGLPDRTYGAAIETDVELAISKLSGDQAARAYGIDTEVGVEIFFDNATDIQVDDLIEPKTGFFVGSFFEVKDVKPGVGLIMLAGAEDSRRRP